ncbi:MAG: lamin tail domain-containing protein [Melioribacteraceae bacterium]
MTSIQKILVGLILLIILNQTQFSQIYINEFMASNATTIQNYNYSDWIELYNDSKTAIDLKDYFLTDDLSNPTKWKFVRSTIIQSKGFIVLWATTSNGEDGEFASGVKLNFKLKKDREEIGLYNSQKVIQDSIKYDSQITDVSFGRNPDGGSGWFYFGEPTPGKTNNTIASANTEHTDDVEFSLTSGVYKTSQQVQLSSNSANAVITFTTDGTKPKSNSSIYSTPFEISKTTIIRARTFEDNKLPGKIITKSFFINTPHTLPIVSITSNPDLLFGEVSGIYSNAILGKEVPVNIELLETDNTEAINAIVSVRVTGQASWRYPQKSLTISAKKKYGTETLKYKVFPDRELTEFSSLYLRNSGTQDNRHTMFRDPLQHSIAINEMDLDLQAYRPVVTYINGKYWGIYNLREKLNKKYLASHHNVNTKNIDYLEYDFQPEPVVLDGSSDDFDSFIEYLETHNINDEEVYNYVKSQLDINEIMNYLMTEIYCDNVNWPYTNTRWWRENPSNSKWRYVLVDLDYGFGAPSFSSLVGNNTFEFLFNQPEELKYGTFLFRKLLQNFEFRDKFVQRFAMLLNTTFSRNRVTGIVDSIKGLINSEMPRHIDRWDDDPVLVFNYPPIPNMAAWNVDVKIMQQFAQLRSGIVRGQLNDFFLLNGTDVVNLSIPNSEFGKVFIENKETKDGFEGKFFKFTPLRIKAVPQIGYRFVKWSGIEGSLNSETSISISEAINLAAVFEETGDNLLPSIFATSKTLDIIGSPYYARGDIQIKESTTLTIDKGVKIIMPPKASIIVKGNIILNGTNDEPILIKENQKYGYSNWGSIFISNATDSSVIKYVQITGATNGKDKNSQKGAISILNSKVTIENVVIENVPFPIFAQNSSVVIRNSLLNSNTTSDLINIKNSNFAIVENCELRGNNSVDVDAIDYDNVTNGIIRGNRIYNFLGNNSDGIDLGEGSKNILIKNNLIYNCYDKGISVGQAATAIIENNIIVNCTQGIGVKNDNSFAEINQNTFYACDYGVACFEKNIGSGGGSANVVNSIFFQSKTSPVFVDAFSTLNVSYSIYDKKILDGIENKKVDPKFVNNFSLSSNSPAINSGDPSSKKDPDGSQADIGAVYYSGIVAPQIIINEVLYNSEIGSDNQFIELLNIDDKSIDLSSFTFSGGISFTFPIGTSIQPNEYIVIAKNKDVYLNNGYKVFQWNEESLSKDWGNIILSNNNKTVIDLITYNNSLLTTSFNSSIELVNSSLENLYQYNWQESFNQGGSPGSENIKNNNLKLYINEFQASNTKTIADDFGEFEDWIEIYNASEKSININGLYITDNFENLTKYKLHSSAAGKSIIKAKGFYLLWADENSKQGNNHLNFKLSSKGEQIALVSVVENDTTIIDSISYTALGKDISYARIDDGGNEWKTFTESTPGYSNDPTTDIVINNIVERFSLSQNYPNPFNPLTTINYSIPEVTTNISSSVNVVLKVYDVLGREVMILVNEAKPTGNYKVQFNASSLASGIYYYQLRADNPSSSNGSDFIQTKKMILLK